MVLPAMQMREEGEWLEVVTCVRVTVSTCFIAYWCLLAHQMMGRDAMSIAVVSVCQGLLGLGTPDPKRCSTFM